MDFDGAAGLADYLAALGVSHLYTSPCLQAAPGSTHGYDVVDPSRMSRDLGGEEGYRRLMDSLRAEGLGAILDIVPNHMAVSGPENPWWWDLLEHGLSSRYAGHFDVDWQAAEADGGNAILLPVLDDHVGRVVAAGRIRLVRDGARFQVVFEDHRFPVDAASLGEILARVARDVTVEADELETLASALRSLPRAPAPGHPVALRRHRESTVLLGYLGRLIADSPSVARTLAGTLSSWGDDPELMDRFLGLQNYRLAHWRLARSELGYRRFFHINELVALRMDQPEVFEDAHGRILEAVRAGEVDGLRIDHPDGLLDPGGYLERLAGELPATWIVAEKILETGEELPGSWPIAGTTGYEFLNLVGGLFVDPAGEEGLSGIHREFSGFNGSFSEEVHRCKELAFRRLLGSDLNRLVALLQGVCRGHPQDRDHTETDLRDALVEVAASFPVYRTYIRPGDGAPSADDARVIDRAVAAARASAPHLWPDPLRFIADLLHLRHPGRPEKDFVLRFQELTGPVMAKGVEDTAFYRYHRLTSLNEVGGDPRRFGVTVEAFHDACRRIQSRRPQTLLTTSTHDTKRSEDVRARLHVLSEMPAAWARVVRDWRRHNAGLSGAVDGGTEYLVYQTLVGAWPLSPERLLAFMEKAIREAKLRTSWTDPDAGYEEDVRRFCRAIMGDQGFLDGVEAFVETILGPGRLNALSQTLIKLTAPGVPDIYQGCELWDLSLVDPDNRRPVDFAHRQRILDRLLETSGSDPHTESILAGMDEGLPKMHVIQRCLALRRDHPDPFGPSGTYESLEVGGAEARGVVGFLRGGRVAVLAPRFSVGRTAGWKDTCVQLPPGAWRNQFTLEVRPGGEVPVQELLARFPVALLVHDSVDGS